MKSTVLALAAALSGASGCIVSDQGDVRAGDRLAAQLYLTWETQDSRTNERISCYSAGADTVRVTARNASTDTVYTDLFDCGAGAGKTYSLTAGNYYINVDLVRCAGDASCVSEPALSSASTIGPYGVWDDVEFDLGHFVLLVD